MRVVLDTNVLISGFIYPGSVPGRIVRAWRDARFELVMSKEQLTEIARVLTYPKIARILRWKRDKIERLLKQLYLRSIMVEIEASTTIESLRDPDDSPILLSLVAADAERLVTGDRDLLALREHYPIVTPAEFVVQL